MEQKEVDRGRVTSGAAVFMRKTGKGQVTVFIILGLLLLLALLLLVFFRKELFAFRPSELIPTEKGRLGQVVTGCIETLGDEALSLLGAQGGYIEVPPDIKNDAALHLALSPFLVIPYWAYGENSRVPSLQEIKLQLDRYLEDNLAECALSQELFRTSYEVRQKAPPDADTEITDKKVLFNVRWNIEIRDPEGEVIAELLQHQAESKVKLKKVHETARTLVEQELKTLKLEDITQDLIALEHPRVPVAGIEFSCGQKRWLVEDVKSGLQDLLRINVRELRVSGTNIIEFPEELPYYQHHYVFDMGVDDTGKEFGQEDVSVLFSYENAFPLAMEVSPASGRYLKSNQMLSGNELLSAICIQAWKFVYDVSYPVLVTVTDETTGYSFRTAFTVHLQKNIPDRSAVPRRDATAYFDAFTDEEFCLERRIPMTVSTYEVISDRASGVFVKEPLEDVELTFTCLKYSCSSGKTEYDFAGRGDVAAYSTNFPYCVGGILRGVKERYKDDWERVVTEAGKEIELELAPLHEVPLSNIRIVKHDAGSGRTADIEQEETVLLTMKYWREEGDGVLPALLLPRQLFHEEQVVISPSLDARVLEEETLTFLAGADFTYELGIQVLDDGTFIGGYQGNWTVSWDELQPAEEVTFHIVSRERATEEEVFEMLGSLAERSREVPLPELR